MNAAPSDGQKDTAVTTILTPERLAEYRAHYPNRNGYREACVIGHDGHYAPFPCLPYLLAAEVSLFRAQIGDVNDLHQRAEVGIHDLCDGCNVREPWEHRCHGEPCTCPECREERRLFGSAAASPGEADTDPASAVSLCGSLAFTDTSTGAHYQPTLTTSGALTVSRRGKRGRHPQVYPVAGLVTP